MRYEAPEGLTQRWTPMRDHVEQLRLLASPARFKVVPAGRRSGKTERAKRRIVKCAINAATYNYPDPRFGCAAPTFQQAKNIYWTDLKALVPPQYVRKISETDLCIYLHTGAEIRVVGMDKPQRVEGFPWDGMILDEYGNMKEGAWNENVRPALEDRNGWAWLIGVPEGRNHYYDLYMYALGEGNIRNGGDWDAFTWKSIDILPPERVEAARRDMDTLTFQQEYEASFINFAGQAYYPFSHDIHCAPLFERYNPRGELLVMLDFNVDPGIAVIGQEMELPERRTIEKGIEVGGKKLFAGERVEPKVVGTGIIGEVYIPRNSNTPAVCRKIYADWKHHEGLISVFGDATGGARTTQSETGASDWDLVRENLYRDFGQDRVTIRLELSNNGKPQNPPERHRVNAMNSRLMSDDGTIRMMVDGAKAPMTVKDFEGVRLLEGGSGELDKKHDPKLTHLTDAVGYYVHKRFPVRRDVASITELSR